MEKEKKVTKKRKIERREIRSVFEIAKGNGN